MPSKMQIVTNQKNISRFANRKNVFRSGGGGWVTNISRFANRKNVFRSGGGGGLTNISRFANRKNVFRSGGRLNK